MLGTRVLPTGPRVPTRPIRMARKKVRLERIANDTARKATFKKRKKGLLKKVSELSTLCDVDACAIVYSRYEDQADVWPSPTDVHRVLTRFKSLPEADQSKKMMNQEEFLTQRIRKLRDQVRKQQKENRDYEMIQIMYQSLGGKGLDGLGTQDLEDLVWLVDEKMKAISERIEVLKKDATEVTQVMVTATVGTNDKMKGVVESAEDDQMSLDAAMTALKDQNPWYMDVMTPHEHMSYVGDDRMMMTYGDNSSWPNLFYN